MSRGNFRCSRNAGRCGQVFNKDHLVLRLVVEQLIGYPANHGNAESAWTYAELIADVHMCNRCLTTHCARSSRIACVTCCGATPCEPRKSPPREPANKPAWQHSSISAISIWPSMPRPK